MTVSNFGAAFYTIGDGSIEKLREYQNERVGLVVDENIVKALGLHNSDAMRCLQAVHGYGLLLKIFFP